MVKFIKRVKSRVLRADLAIYMAYNLVKMADICQTVTV